MNNYFKLISIVLVYISCTKEIDYNKYFITGKLQINDALNEIVKVVPNEIVGLYKVYAGENILIYTDSTDSDGNFQFSLLVDQEKDTFLILYSNSNNKLKFKAIDISYPGKRNISLKANPVLLNQSFVKFITKDSLGGHLSFTDINIYRSKILGEGNFKELAQYNYKTNFLGQYMTILDTGKYFIKSSLRLDTNSVLENNLYELNIDQNNVNIKCETILYLKKSK